MEPGRARIMRELQVSLGLLAGSGREALQSVPDGCAKADELAFDYCDALHLACEHCAAAFTPEQLEALRLVDRLLGEMSGRTNAELWTDEAVLSGVRWREVRAAAQAAVGCMGWSEVLRRS